MEWSLSLCGSVFLIVFCPVAAYINIRLSKTLTAMCFVVITVGHCYLASKIVQGVSLAEGKPMIVAIIVIIVAVVVLVSELRYFIRRR